MDFSTISESVSSYVLQDPLMRSLQSAFILVAVVLLFLLFFALRDILLRTRSFWYQFGCVVLVAVLPVVGFLVYLLIRPARTIKEREQEEMIGMLYGVLMQQMFEDVELEDMEDLEDDEDSDDSEDDDEDDEDEDDQIVNVEDDEDDEDEDEDGKEQSSHNAS